MIIYLSFHEVAMKVGNEICALFSLLFWAGFIEDIGCLNCEGRFWEFRLFLLFLFEEWALISIFIQLSWFFIEVAICCFEACCNYIFWLSGYALHYSTGFTNIHFRRQKLLSTKQKLSFTAFWLISTFLPWTIFLLPLNHKLISCHNLFQILNIFSSLIDKKLSIFIAMLFKVIVSFIDTLWLWIKLMGLVLGSNNAGC